MHRYTLLSTYCLQLGEAEMTKAEEDESMKREHVRYSKVEKQKAVAYNAQADAVDEEDGSTVSSELAVLLFICQAGH
jgi:hypothetical protein